MPRDALDPVNARPTVRIDNLELPVLDQALHAMTMRERVGGMASLELSLVDWTSAADGRAGFAATGSDNPIRLGKSIEIYAGDAATPRQIFAGRITGLETEVPRQGPPLITILAEDALFSARRVRRRRLFEDSSPSDIVKAIAQDHALQANVRDGLDGPVTNWAQMNETDLGFLRRVLARVDADAQVVGSELQAGPRGRDKRTELELSYPREIVAARITADLAHQYAKTRAAGFDPDTGEAVRADSADPELGPGDGRDSAQVLGAEFAEWSDHLGGLGPLSQEEADVYSRAAQGARARGFVTADGTAMGDPEIRVGSWLTLRGLNPMFQNTYCVVEATHRFDRQDGYMTDFIAESAYLGEAA